MVVSIRCNFSKGSTCEEKQKWQRNYKNTRIFSKENERSLKKQFVREVSTSKFLLFQSKIDSILNQTGLKFCNGF